VAHDSRWSLDLPGVEGCRAYLLQTLESTLSLLEKAGDSDQALYFYRLCLFHEDMHAEAMTSALQALGLPLDAPLRKALTPAAMTLREPLHMPATRWSMGSVAESPGFVFDNEAGQHDVTVPEFEIDAQPVSWAQYVEFVADGVCPLKSSGRWLHTAPTGAVFAGVMCGSGWATTLRLTPASRPARMPTTQRPGSALTRPCAAAPLPRGHA
jgi:formylglycine-generating enzyme required for sulfatase activity